MYIRRKSVIRFKRLDNPLKLLSYSDLMPLLFYNSSELIDYIKGSSNIRILHFLFAMLNNGFERRLRQVVSHPQIISVLRIETAPRSPERLYIDLLTGFWDSKHKKWKQDMNVFMYYLYRRGATFIPGDVLVSKGINEGVLDVNNFFGYEGDIKYILNSKGIKILKRQHVRTMRADHKAGTVGYLVIMEPKLYKQIGGT